MKYIVLLLACCITTSCLAQNDTTYIVSYEFYQPEEKHLLDTSTTLTPNVAPVQIISSEVKERYTQYAKTNEMTYFNNDSIRFEKRNGWHYKTAGKWKSLELLGKFEVEKIEGTKIIQGYKCEKFIWSLGNGGQAVIWATNKLPSTLLRSGMEDFGYGVLEIQSIKISEWSVKALKVEKVY